MVSCSAEAEKETNPIKPLESNCVRLFAQIGWYFRREWRRYLGAVVLLIVIAILQLLPPKLVGIIVDGVTENKCLPAC